MGIINWYTFHKEQDIGIISGFLPQDTYTYQLHSKEVTLQWRNLAEMGLTRWTGLTSPLGGGMALHCSSWHDALEEPSFTSLELLPGRRDLSLDIQVEGHPTEWKGCASGTQKSGKLRTIPDWQDTSGIWQLVFLDGILGQKGKGNVVGTVYQIWTVSEDWIGDIIWMLISWFRGLYVSYRRVSLFLEIHIGVFRGDEASGL